VKEEGGAKKMGREVGNQPKIKSGRERGKGVRREEDERKKERKRERQRGIRKKGKRVLDMWTVGHYMTWFKGRG